MREVKYKEEKGKEKKEKSGGVHVNMTFLCDKNAVHPVNTSAPKACYQLPPSWPSQHLSLLITIG